MNFYLIRNAKGKVLHYIRGELFWNTINGVESVLDNTQFETKEKADQFIKEKGILNATGVVEVTLALRDV